jgi:hypothetical protein
MLDRTFAALADPTRRDRRAVERRGRGQRGSAGAAHPVSLPAIIKHLDVLSYAGLITARAPAGQ